MREFVVADTHFFHGAIIGYEYRPFLNVHHMNEFMINQWNSTVDDDDVVWFLGDFGLGNANDTRQIMNRLKGHKYLVMGNHDLQRTVSFWQKAGFEMVYRTPVFFDTYVLSHHPLKYVRYTSLINICGHVHSRISSLEDYHRCVSVEVTGYKPVLLKDALRGVHYEDPNTLCFWGSNGA